MISLICLVLGVVALIWGILNYSLLLIIVGIVLLILAGGVPYYHRGH